MAFYDGLPADIATGFGVSHTKALIDPYKRKAPQYQGTSIDPDTQKSLDRQITYAQLSPEEIARRQLSGSQEASQRAIKDYASQLGYRSVAAGGNQDQGYLQALADKASRQATKDYALMEKGAVMDANIEKAQRLEKAFDLLKQQDAIRMQVADRENNARWNQYAARANTIRGVLGLAGAAVGAYFGGVTGAQVGQGVGQAAGGPKKDFREI